jgi:fructokinase
MPLPAPGTESAVHSRGPLGKLGGAPANFSVMAGRLGNHATILSRIGRDQLGRDAIDRLNPMSVDIGALQLDPAHATGRVTVDLSLPEPRYTIHGPVAWDYMQLSDEWVRLAERADAICFGSLAQRSEQSRQTIQMLAAQTASACIRVFDVNLRPPFYSEEIVEESLELATVAKMNETEAPLILDLLGLAAAEPPFDGTLALRFAAERLLEEFPGLQMVAITRGSHGSLLVTREEWNEHPGFPITVGDAIGAGDAFTAAMTHYLLRGAGLATLNEAGNRWGGWVASQSGAMPALPEAVRAAITAEIEGAI